MVNKDDADEAVQETFLKVYQGLPRFNGRYELGAWVARIATNVCLDQVRASGRKPCDATPAEKLESEGPEDLEPEAIVLSRAQARTVRRVLASLPETHRAAIVLRDFEGFSYDEIAEILKMSPTQVKALIHRARKGFRRSWVSVASSFFTLRLPRKFRDASLGTRERLAEVSGPAMPAAAQSCSMFVQQCGTFVAERFVPIFAASVVGTAAVGAGVVGAQSPAPVRGDSFTESAGAVTSARTFERAALKPSKKQAPLRDQSESDPEVGPITEDPVVTEPETPVEPAPEPTPTEEPPAPEPSPTEPGPEKDGGGDPAPEGEAERPVTLPVLAFDQGQPISGTAPTSVTRTVDCDSGSLQQQMSTMVGTKDGAQPGALGLGVGSSASIDLTMQKSGYEIRYVGGGALTKRTQTQRYLTLDYAGSFGTGSVYAGAAGLPSDGRFGLHLVLDCSTQTVTSQELVLRGH